MLFTALILVSQVYAATPKTVTLKSGTNETVGTVTLTPMAKGVKLSVDIAKLPPGEHAIHFHDTGTCTGPKFDSAGGHFAPGTKGHGFDAAEGFHAGDMANILVGADGKAKIEIVNSNVTLESGATSLMKTGGTALVIHEKADDYKSQPSGNAGSRLACGEIK